MSAQQQQRVWEGQTERLDRALPALGLARSRTHAETLIREGHVQVGAQPARKPAQRVPAGTALTVHTEHTYVSRGALKLVAALDEFAIEAQERVALDVGASTGGFTQVLLECGAARVLAIDVGHNQLVPELRDHPRVRAADGVNARYLTRDGLYEVTGEAAPPQLIVGDVSFISLTHLLPALAALVDETGDLVLLIKPQFEVGKTDIGQGVVVDPQLQAGALEQVLNCAQGLGLYPQGLCRSPILGGQGNREFLVHLRTQQPDHFVDWHEKIAEITSGERETNG